MLETANGAKWAVYKRPRGPLGGYVGSSFGVLLRCNARFAAQHKPDSRGTASTTGKLTFIFRYSEPYDSALISLASQRHLGATMDRTFTPALMRVFAMELHSACRVHPVPLEIKLRLEQLRLIELIRAQGVAPSPRAKGFEPLAAAG